MEEAGHRQKLNSLTVDELRRRAKQAGHGGLSRLRKAELINLLLEGEAEEQPAELPKAQSLEPSQPVPGFVYGLLKSAGLLGGLLSMIITLALPVLLIWVGGQVSLALARASDNAQEIEMGLGLAADNLEHGATALESGSQALRTANRSLVGLDPLLGSVGDLLGEELPESIETTRQALLSAQQGAAAMDRVMRGLRFFGLDYDPAMPLDQSLEQTADGLDGLPESLRQTENDLSQSQQDLALMRQDLAELAANLDEFAADLDSTADEIHLASGSMGQVAEALDDWAARMPRLRWLLAAAAGLVGVWLFTLHLNLWVVGKLAAER